MPETRKYTVVDLFAGVGGLSYGFSRNEHYEIILANEMQKDMHGRKASPEIWALNNFKEFEVWYDANKKELEANARKKGPKGKTAAKIAA